MRTRHYEGAELEFFADAKNWKAYVARQLASMITGDVLEVGAGIGITTQTLNRPTVRSWTALEPDPALAQRARAIQQAPGCPRVDVVVGVLDDLPPSQVFDTILYVDVLEHIDDDASQLELAAQHACGGGRVIVLAPAHQWLFSPFDESIGHFRRYDRSMIESLATPGLRLDRCWYIDSAGLLVSAANRLVLRSSQPRPSQIKMWDRALVPISRMLDPLLGRKVGKSIIAVWTRDEITGPPT